MTKQNVNIELCMTNNCNCNCAYCFENCHSGFKRNIEEEYRQIELLVEFCQNFNKQKYSTLTISFWGGEPFLNLDFMTEVFAKTATYDFVRYHIYSNGTLLENYKCFLKQDFIDSIKPRCHIQLSYDGEPHHTLKRGDTKSIVFKVAHLLFDCGFTVAFKATLTYDMIKHLSDIWDSYEEAYYEFNGKINYSPTLDTRHVIESDFNEWKRQLVNIAKKELSFFGKNGTFLMNWFNFPMKCSCQLQNSISVNTNGNIYFCHGCFYASNNERFMLGSTSSIKSFSDVILENTDITSEVNQTCNTCTAVYCAVCHVSQIDDTEQNIRNAWEQSRSKNNARCKYYQEFGRIYNAMQLSLMNRKMFYG